MISASTLQARGALGVTSDAALALPDQHTLAFLGSGVGPSLDEGGGLGMSPAKRLGVSTDAIELFCCIHLGRSLAILRLAHMLQLGAFDDSILDHDSDQLKSSLLNRVIFVCKRQFQ